MVGILDFTNNVVMAIKEGARTPNTILNSQLRLSRCPCNTLGLLQAYSLFDAEGQSAFKINKINLNERHISRLTVSKNTSKAIDVNSISLLISLLLGNDFHTFTFLPVEDEHNQAIIHIIFNSKPSSYPCDIFKQAISFSREVQYAFELFEEERCTYIPSEDEINE